eukprot:9361611-Pyramimonas_sp.AAC.1
MAPRRCVLICRRGASCDLGATARLGCLVTGGLLVGRTRPSSWGKRRATSYACQNTRMISQPRCRLRGCSMGCELGKIQF